MDSHDAIITPVKGKGALDPESLSVLVSSSADLKTLCRMAELDESDSRNLFISRLYIEGSSNGFSVSGPFVGAPYAVMILETLIAWGVQRVVLLGWCGAVSPSVKIGDIILPTSSFIDEGTSGSYVKGEGGISHPSDSLKQKVKAELTSHGLSFHEGTIWTTDAIYRETEEKVRFYQERNVLAVEMETSAVFTVGKFRNIEVCAILVVSDELSAFKWKPGFSERTFRKSRISVCEVLHDLCRM
jgi:purine-nucleoside phosphorylase